MAPSRIDTLPSGFQVDSNGTTMDSSASRVITSLDQPACWNLSTYFALFLLVGLWAVQVFATWGAWGNLTVDSGHEMYIPALLAQGKVLYRDVWFPYGPAAPYLNSYFFRLFGIHLNVLYWAGCLSALGSAVFLYLAGMRLSSWHGGWSAGAVLLLQAFQPSLFSFPLPYSFSTVYGCLMGCVFLWLAVVALEAMSSWWILGAGTAAAAALLFKPEFGTACYATLALVVAVRSVSQRSWRRLATDALAILPGIVACGLVILWMLSVGGVQFMTQENLVGWPTSYFMKTYGKMWLEYNGFTISGAAFGAAVLRAIPVAGLLLASWCILRWKRYGTRGIALKVLMALLVLLYLVKNNYFILPPRQTLQFVLTTFFFPRDMVLYVGVAALPAWIYSWTRRHDPTSRSAAIAVVLTYSVLLAFRILMKMHPDGYPVFYDGPVVLSFLLLACGIIPRSGRSKRFVFCGEVVICLACLTAVALPTLRSEAAAKLFVPLTTERGTIRVSQHLRDNYAAAIQFMKKKSEAGESVLSVPEDTSLYFLSGTYCPTRVFAFTPGIVAPGSMTNKMIQEIEQKPVRYLLWSNRIFPEFGTPVFGKDFDVEIGDYLKAHYHRVGPLMPAANNFWDWTAVIWERNATAGLP